MITDSGTIKIEVAGELISVTSKETAIAILQTIKRTAFNANLFRKALTNYNILAGEIR